MQNSTYPDQEVKCYILGFFIPVQLNQKEMPDIFTENRILRTPTLTIRTFENKETERWSGFLPPDSFIAKLKTARAKLFLLEKQYQQTISLLGEIYKNHPDSGWRSASGSARCRYLQML